MGFTEPFIDARDVIRSLGMKDDFITRVYQTSDALIIQVETTYGSSPFADQMGQREFRIHHGFDSRQVLFFCAELMR